MIKELGINKSTIIFNINIVKLIDENPKLKKSYRNCNIFEKNVLNKLKKYVREQQ